MASRYGLSYTTFDLSDLKLSAEKSKENDATSHTASVTVTNTGSVKGSTVAQLYIGLPDDGITHPKLQLRGFAKAKDIEPGENKTVQIELERLAFAYWDETKDGWKVPKGTFTVKVGQNADDLPLMAEVKIEKSVTWKGL
jgi:beta-glucosidase